MPVLELDLLIAFVNEAGRHYEVADEIFLEIKEGRLKEVFVAVSVLLKYELLHKSKGYMEGELPPAFAGGFLPRVLKC